MSEILKENFEKPKIGALELNEVSWWLSGPPGGKAPNFLSPETQKKIKEDWPKKLKKLTEQNQSKLDRSQKIYQKYDLLEELINEHGGIIDREALAKEAMRESVAERSSRTNAANEHLKKRPAGPLEQAVEVGLSKNTIRLEDPLSPHAQTRIDEMKAVQEKLKKLARKPEKAIALADLDEKFPKLDSVLPDDITTEQ